MLQILYVEDRNDSIIKKNQIKIIITKDCITIYKIKKAGECFDEINIL